MLSQKRKYLSHRAFTLIEILVGILIVTIIFIAWFQALSSVWIAKIKMIEKSEIEKESYLAAEMFFELIKKGGTIDYEEYWNRTAMDTDPISGNFAPEYSSWHYLERSSFWNYGQHYLCISLPGNLMGTWGCLNDHNVRGNAILLHSNLEGFQQKYNRYKIQFIDYNSDADNDNGDEDGVGTGWSATSGLVMGDEDDLVLGVGPEAFPLNRNMSELYLINLAGTQRTFFRWKVMQDPYAPSGASCNNLDSQIPTGSGCLGTIQVLKMTGLDEGYDHGVYAGTAGDGIWDNDGEIDTWIIDEAFDPHYATGTNPHGAAGILALSWAEAYWQDIFSDSLNIVSFEVYPYPNKDLSYSWRDTDPSIRVAPYVQIKMIVQPSWKKKKMIRWAVPQVEISTTIALSDLDFR